MNLTKSVCRLLHRVLRQAGISAKRVSEAVRAWWRTHRERMTSEPHYAEALVAVSMALIDLITNSTRARYITRELAHAYIAVVRALRPEGDEEQGWA